MKPRPFDYIRADTVEEALAALAEYGEEARILAGGQTLIAMLNLRVVDASIFPRIPGYFIVTSVYMIAEKAADAILESPDRFP